uniref:Na_H_Exchanger domain-containing protein n=1 Tax=Rhabditophanes sp. KR3021 TaxID=114890 RepID=A0AC35UHI3_9BILA
MSWSINHSNPHPSRRRIRPINRTRENPDIGSDVYRRRQPAITGTYPNTGFVRYDFESLIESLNSSAFEASQHFALNSAPVERRYPIRSSRTATLRRITDSVVGNRRRQAPRAPSFSPDTTPQPHLFTTRQPTPIPTSSMISEARATAANNLRLSRSIGANTETGRNIGRRGLFGRVLHSASRDSDMLIDNEIDRLMFLDNNDRDSWPAVGEYLYEYLLESHEVCVLERILEPNHEPKLMEGLANECNACRSTFSEANDLVYHLKKRICEKLKSDVMDDYDEEDNNPTSKAGYLLPNKSFFKNIGTILTLSVGGTLLNILLIGGVLVIFRPYYSVDVPLIDISLFAIIISAVDPVSIIALFQEIHVNEDLYICVFGESLLNDAVTIVLYHSLVSEMVHMSGILAIMTCAVLMKPYIKNNISDESIVTVKYFIKTMSSTSETIIFAFLGFSIVNEHQFDYVFAIVTLVACFVVRFLVTFVLTGFVNKYRSDKLSTVDKLIISYSGIRGAIAYGMVKILDGSAHSSKSLFITTTVIIICFTTFVQGSSMKFFIRILHVKLGKRSRDKTVVDFVLNNVQDDLVLAVESIAGIRSQNYWRRRLSLFNRDYAVPFFTAGHVSRADDLNKTYNHDIQEQNRDILLRNTQSVEILDDE